MEVTVGEKNYLLFELKTPMHHTTSDIIAIFETKGQNVNDFIFIDYFYGASVMTKEEMQKVAIDYIQEHQKNQ